MKDNWLIISAHPDDEVLGCGGIIDKYSGTVNFIILVISEGSTCRFEDCTSTDAQNAVRQRNGYFVESMNSLKIDTYKLCDYPCGRLDIVPIIEINKIIEFDIRKYRPTKVFTHSCYDTNNDHRVVARATEMACRPSVFGFIESIYAYEVLSTSECNLEQPFAPNYFVELSESNVNAKWKALEVYKSEVADFPFPRSREALFALAQYRGIQAGQDYSESFRTIRSKV